MAVVTHGGTLPDSSQKTDFYALIDNATVTSITGADMSASAAIQDTQLSTISTAGKVNTSSLTGQVANANLVQLTTAALVSGAALTLLPNIPSGAGLIPTANIPITTSNYGSSASSSTPVTQGLKIAFGSISVGATSDQNITNLSFTSSSSYSVVACSVATNAAVSTIIVSGSQCTLHNNDGSTRVINWMAIGF